MDDDPTLEDARVSLAAHVAEKGAEIRRNFGPIIGWPQLQRILADRECVRYPCEIAFDAGPLEPGECAFPEPMGERPEDGFRLCVHPHFSADPARVPLLALYQIVSVNYGAFASPGDAEAFGAAALGIPQEEYYAALCAMADEISTGNPEEGCAETAVCRCGGGSEFADPGISDFAKFGNPCAQYAKEWPDSAAVFWQDGKTKNASKPRSPN